MTPWAQGWGNTPVNLRTREQEQEQAQEQVQAQERMEAAAMPAAAAGAEASGTTATEGIGGLQGGDRGKGEVPRLSCMKAARVHCAYG